MTRGRLTSPGGDDVRFMRMQPWPVPAAPVLDEHRRARDPWSTLKDAHAIRSAAKIHAKELRMMAAAVTSAPWELFGQPREEKGGPMRRVSLSPLPQAATTSPAVDQSRSARVGASSTTLAPSVLLVHGLAGTASVWRELAGELRARGLTASALSYRSFGTPLEQLAQRLAGAVEAFLAETGANKVHLVGHSL